jgi:IS5 family transposase
MRKATRNQLPISLGRSKHGHTKELEEISRILDENPEINELVYADLIRDVDPDKGNEGLSAEQVLRALIVRQSHDYTYDELAYHLGDSMGFRWFCRLEVDEEPSSSALQRDIKKVRAETMEAINQILIGYAKDNGIENGRKTRTDCTVMETTIHEPSDSSLLWDSVRVLTRLLNEAKEALPKISFRDHTRRAKRRAFGILNAKKKQQRVLLYTDLLKVTGKTIGYAKQAVELLERKQWFEIEQPVDVIAAELHHYIVLAERVIDQTRRRVMDGETVPASEKVVSIFEPHTNIIVKDRRDTLFGHKLCLTGGASGLVLDCVILEGNPADSTLAVDMMKRHKQNYGYAPRQAAFDGGFTSIDNLADIKLLGVKDVAFSKRRGLEITEMVKSSWVYRQLRNFRAGIEGTISFLKRCFGLARCTWRSLASFRSYAWSSIVSANLLVIARHALQ